MRVDFYHLSRDPAPAVLALIAGKVLAAGQHLLVTCEDEAQRAALSDFLWEAPGFLANGEASEEGAASQPILIAPDGAGAANGARYIAMADGRWPVAR